MTDQTPSFGFLIDNRKCIGCHACSTACKSENEVPLGVNRTWVKYVEKGVFPDTRRFFQVTRCNHCANPPCVYICPTAAMYQRKDGIVEFDSNACIGCKACLQACPYDAIYIDPNLHTAAKCHFCAHRTELGLEPACVVVCPEQAIWAGDINDPNSAISKEIATHQVRARKPEQGTKPKLFYIDAEESVIVPGLAQQSNVTLWSSMPENGSGGYHDWRGPLQLGEGKMAGALINTAAAPREVYNTPHRIPWHWPVPAYLVTKSIGTGIFMIAAAGLGLGVLPNMPLFTSIAGALSLLFIAITTVLLIADLDKPSRFLSILTRPQWRSWLARGAYILIGFSIVGGLWWLGQILGGQIQNAASILIVPGIILAALTAIYTAFLFAQAEGRDLWQSPILAPHLFVQAVMAGAAGLLICSLFIGITPQALQVLTWVFVISTLANVLFIISEFSITHASAVASMAAHLIKKSKYRKFYLLAVIVGGVIPLALVLVGIGSLGIVALASVCSLIGLGAYEWAFVMAPQEIPNN